jgi:branched-chain amino acid aminotransferase
VHQYLLHNGQIRETGDAVISPGQVGFMNGWGVFSTLRVFNGVLFAFERHYARMKRDAALTHVPFLIKPEELKESLLSLVDANAAFNATLRVAMVRNKGGIFEGPRISRDTELIAFTTDLADWGAGVKLTYVKNGRFGACPFAGAKITSWAQNLTWNEEAHQHGFDEVILLNERGQVSECTSANIFAVHGSRVSTPPLSTSGCLPGVTRAVLLEETSTAEFHFCERELLPNDLESGDQVFITSTTRDLIPVLSVDRRPLKQSPSALSRIFEQFRCYRSAYIVEHAHKKEMLA